MHGKLVRKLQNYTYTYSIALWMQGVFPPDFTNSILAWMDSWHVHDQKLHNLKFNELTIAFAALGNVVFPFSVPGSRMMQIPTLSSGFETPTLYC